MSTSQAKRPRPDGDDEADTHELKHKVRASQSSLPPSYSRCLLTTSTKRNCSQTPPNTNCLQKLRPLPFRTSPSSEARTLAFSQRPARSVPATLTPVESSDEDSGNVEDIEDDRNNEDMDTGPILRLPVSQTSKSSSVNIGVSDDLDLDMVDSQPRSPLPWQSRTLLSPPLPQNLLSLPVNPSGGRIPTPIYGHFTNDVNMEMGELTAANVVPTIREEDDWWRKRELPSPISDHDSAMVSPMGETYGMMGRLHVGGVGVRPPSNRVSDSVNSMFLRRPESQAVDRPSKLVMGYRADCEKCRQKVPGHYSHIVRS